MTGKKLVRLILLAVGAAGIVLAGCACMDLVWSAIISRADLARSRSITGIETCHEMSHSSFRTWRFFETKGRQTYFIRSDCFLQVALRDRDADLCAQVVERTSLYFDGSAVSENACLQAVQQLRPIP